MLAEPQNCGAGAGAVDCSDYALVVLPRFAWFRQGAVAVDKASGAVTLSPMGMPARTVLMTKAGDSIAINNSALSAAHLVFGLGEGSVGLQEQAAGAGAAPAPPTLAGITKVISAAREKEYDSYKKYGDFAEVKEGLQAATMWNYVRFLSFVTS